MDVVGLLGRVLPDAIVLVERVLQQAQEQLKPDGAAGDMSPHEVVVTALGNRLARMISDGGSSAVEDWPATDVEVHALGHYEELVDTNSVLAAALGACDCWGRDVNCPFCDGTGGPGWALPDERLFASFVRPALESRNLSGSSTVPKV
jgi:CDGSH-type Zn-finger protein